MKYLIISITLFFWSTVIYGQEYVDFVTQDEVKIEYKWRKKDLLKKDSPYVMYLRITNKSIDRKMVSFELFYFLNGLTHSKSGFKEYCIKAGQTIKGKRWDLVFESDIKTLEEIDDRSFLWEIEKLKVETSDYCETGLKLKLEPAHETDECE